MFLSARGVECPPGGAAAVLIDPAYASDTIEISAPSALGFDEAVAVLGRHAGRRFTFVDEHPSQHENRLREAHTPDGYISWRMAPSTR